MTPTASTPGVSPRKSSYLFLKPRTARLLGAYGIVAMHLWFGFKLILPSETGALELIAGIMALTGAIAAVVFFTCSYSYLANAPDADLDERQILDRDRSYFGAFKYLVAMLAVGGIGSELAAKTIGFTLSTAVFQNYLFMLFIVALILPGCLLAWKDGSSDED